MTEKLTVWYNTKCPVCNAGIDWQHHRLVRAARAGAIDFRDINLEPEALSVTTIEIAMEFWILWFQPILGAIYGVPD